MAARDVGVRQRAPEVALEPTALTEVRAALEAGATPTAALSVVRHGALGSIARELRLGAGLADLAAGDTCADPRVDLLLRGLAVAERTGAGAAEAVAQVLRAADEAEAVRRLLDVRTAQARGTAVVLAVLPLAVWALLVVLDPRTLRFYLTPIGMGTALGSVGLMVLARVVALLMVARVALAPATVDPLRGPEAPRDPWRAAAIALPIGLVLLIGAGPGLAMAGAVLGGLVGLRRQGEPPPDLTGGGTPETAELLAIAVTAGLPPVSALTEVASLGPPAARPALADAARRLAGGWPLEEAFDGTRLEPIGAALAATARWGAPVAPALRRLASEVRADRRAAGEAAAERTQLALIFPTTLLTLPAFVLAVVPPVLWTAFAG